MTLPTRPALCLLATIAAPIHAQTAAPPLSLPQLEATYQAELKKIHVPLIGNYINDLQRLASASRNAGTTVAINEELRRMQSIIKSGGVIDLAQAAAEGANDTAKPTLPPAPAQAAKALITLVPALAKTILPSPAPGAAPDSVPFTKIIWTIEALPRGAYEFVAQCSVQTLEEAATLQITLDRKQLSLPLLQRHLASAPGDFRLLRLGRIELPLDIKDGPLELLLDPADVRASVHLRQLFITRAPPPRPQPSPPAPD